MLHLRYPRYAPDLKHLLKFMNFVDIKTKHLCKKMDDKYCKENLNKEREPFLYEEL